MVLKGYGLLIKFCHMSSRLSNVIGLFSLIFGLDVLYYILFRFVYMPQTSLNS